MRRSSAGESSCSAPLAISVDRTTDLLSKTEHEMKHTVQLTITSLLSILLLTLHITQDILYGMAQRGLSSLAVAVPILVLWLYGTLVLTERRSGYIIILLGSL